jgi:putative ABC transport system permease protein
MTRDRAREWFRTSLRLVPRRLRDRHGVEMESDFLERFDRAAAVSSSRGRAVVAHAVLDAALARPRHWRARRALARGHSGANVLLLDSLRQDLRFAGRLLARQPGFSFTAVITLALGIGANVAIFSVVRTTLLAPLPFGHPETLMQVWETLPSQGVLENTPAPATFDIWRARSRSIEDLAAYTVGTANLTGAGEPERLVVLRTSANLLRVLSISPALGRPFTAEEDHYGAPGAVLLTDRFWTRRFQRDPLALGRAVVLDGVARTVVGVLPSGLSLSISDVDVWVPLALAPAENRQSRMLWVVARAKPGESAVRVQRELDIDMHQAGPEQMPDGIGVNVQALDEELRGAVRPDLLMLFAVSGMVLLIACSNVATMLLARGLARRRELSVRAALGAGRLRLARMMFVESLVLSAAGAGAGLAIAAPALRVIESLMPASLTSRVTGSIDSGVLVFSVILSTLSASLFGIVPIVGTIAGPLTVSTRSDDSSDRRLVRHGRHALVVAELALAVVLLSGASLLVRSFIALIWTPTGFSADGVLTAQIERPDQDDGRRTAFYATVLEAITHLPGVEAAGLTNGMPIRFTGGGSGFLIEPSGEPSLRFVNGHHRIISAAYFQALGIPLIRGQTFTGREAPDGEGVVVVSQSFARQAWNGQDALGRRLKWGDDGAWLRVIGVVADIRLARTLPPEPHVYLPYTQVRSSIYPPTDLLIRTTGRPEALASALREVVRRIDPNQPVSSVMTMTEVLDRSVGRRRFTLALMAIFAGLALLLAAVGVYGVSSYTVRRRQHEIAVRVAMGASTTLIRCDVLWRGLGLTSVGAVVGIAASVALARWTSALVPGLPPPDWLPMTAAVTVLVVVAAAACDIPARRASRADPLVTLRSA